MEIIEQEGAAARLFKQAGAPRHRARERPALMPKQTGRTKFRPKLASRYVHHAAWATTFPVQRSGKE
jgi:hypothetical protein